MTIPAPEEAQDLEVQVRILEAALQAVVPPEHRHLVQQVRQAEELATVAACTDWEQRFLDALIAHFPQLALALRAVAWHVTETNADCDTLRGLPSGRHGH